MGIPDHLICLLRNLYAGQEATVSPGHGTKDWFLWISLMKGVCQGCILSPCLFNFYVEHIMWNARLDESQVGIKMAGRNINNLRYADDTILMAESKEELKSCLMRGEREEWKSWLKPQLSKNKDYGIWSPITSWQTDGGKVQTVTDFILLSYKIIVDSDCSHEIKRCLLLGRKIWQT